MRSIADLSLSILKSGSSCINSNPILLDLLNKSFPNPKRLRTNWLPAHLAVGSSSAQWNVQEIVILNKSLPCFLEENMNTMTLAHVVVSTNEVNMTLVRHIFGTYPRISHSKNEYDALPLHCAVLYSDCVELVQYLLQQFPGATKQKDKSGRTPLQTAILKCNTESRLEVFKTILAADTSVVKSVDVDGNTVLHNILLKIDDFNTVTELAITIIKLLIDIDPTIVECCNFQGDLPLHWACDSSTCNIEVIDLLLTIYKDGAQVLTNNGLLPLHILTAQARLTFKVFIRLREGAYPAALSDGLAITLNILGIYSSV